MKMFLGVLLAAGAAVGFMQHKRIGEFRTALGQKKELAAEAARLRSELCSHPQPALTSEQVSQMSAERTELMRLRAGLANLRVAAQAPEKIEEEIARLNQAAAQEEENARLTKATIEAKYKSKAVEAVLTALSSVIQVSAQVRGGRVPRSFDELREALATSQKISNFPEMWESLSSGFPPFNITKESFEFLPPTQSRNGLLLVREREPRHLPDGTWARYYLTTNNQLWEAKLDNRGFEQWEAEAK